MTDREDHREAVAAIMQRNMIPNDDGGFNFHDLKAADEIIALLSLLPSPTAQGAIESDAAMAERFYVQAWAKSGRAPPVAWADLSDESRAAKIVALGDFRNAVGLGVYATPQADVTGLVEKALAGDHEVRPLSEERLDRILEFEERAGQLCGPGDSATLQWADQRALIAEAVLAFRAREALASQRNGAPDQP